MKISGVPLSPASIHLPGMAPDDGWDGLFCLLHPPAEVPDLAHPGTRLVLAGGDNARLVPGVQDFLPKWLNCY